MSAGSPRDRLRIASALIGVAGLLGCLGAGWFWPSRFYPAYLVGYLFWLGIALGCLAIRMLHALVGGAWGRAVRSPMNAGAMTLVPMAILFVPIALGLIHLYPWADPSLVA